MVQEERWVGVDDVAAHLGVVKDSIYRWVESKGLAHKIIDFLAQIENFQKKLWLKKKFVTETNYCITLDRVPEEFYEQIAANDAQRKEWVKLFAIDEIKQDLAGAVDYSEPLTIEFLKANPFVMLDTKFFSQKFKGRLLTSIEDIGAGCDGVLFHSENFQTLSLLQERYRECVKGIYIDPPYNTDASAIVYKNDYKNSSWMSLIENRMVLASNLMSNTGILCFAIDDEEVAKARELLGSIFNKEVGIAVVRSNPQSRKTKGKFSPVHEYALFYGKSKDSIPGSLQITEKRIARYPKQDDKGRFAWMNFIRTGSNDRRADRPKLYYPIFVNNKDNIRILDMVWSDDAEEYVLQEAPQENEVAVYPISENAEGQIEKNWHRGHNRVSSEPDEYRVRRDAEGNISIDFKTRMDESSMPVTWWDDNEYASANYGAAELKDLFGEKPFDFPKTKKLVEDCLRASGVGEEGNSVIDYFAGSGTTAHAVINLNREDDGNRKYILVEMGEHFDTVLKPRIKKVVYSKDWKEGKPVAQHALKARHKIKTSQDITRDLNGRETLVGFSTQLIGTDVEPDPEFDVNNVFGGISHMFKYIRLESYEDALANIQLKRTETQQSLLDGSDSFRESYMLGYMLDTETAGSESLLNIDAFEDPFNYKLLVGTGSVGETKPVNVDLVETFNWLLGLRVKHMNHIRGFRVVEGTNPKDEKVLVIWRNTKEASNEDLEEFFQKQQYNTLDMEFDLVYVNGDNNLMNIPVVPEEEGAEPRYKVRLIEEEFKRLMFDVKDV